MLRGIQKRAVCILLIFTLLLGLPLSVFAAQGDNTRRSRNATTNLDEAVEAAKKMYYCGELYLFTESMIKINYDMAAIAANLKAYINGSPDAASGKITLNNLISQYNMTSDAYNSWVDLRPRLEKYIEDLSSSNIYSRNNLNINFKNVLSTINAVKPILEAANEYTDNTSVTSLNELNKAADAVIKRAANANKLIEPSLTRSLRGYRDFFEEFSAFAGIIDELEDAESGATDETGAKAN